MKWNCAVFEILATLLFAGSPGAGVDETRIGEHLTVPEGVEVTNAISIGGDVVVLGTVLNDAVSVGGDLVVRSTGRIERYAVSVGGRIVLEPGGLIEGERIEVQNIPGIGILGQLGVLTTQLPQIQRSLSSTLALLKGIYWINAALVALALSLILQVFFPRQVRGIAHTIRRLHWKAFCAGAVASLCIIILVIMTGISVVGIPLIPVFGMVTAAGLLFGYAAAALFAGSQIPLTPLRVSPVLAMVCGVIILTLASAIPTLGPYIFLIAIFTGFGAALRSKLGTRD